MFRIKIDYLENIIEEARAANMRMLYLCVCVCVCVRGRGRRNNGLLVYKIRARLLQFGRERKETEREI